ncbi:MAG: hypothetical protein R3F56_07400 [Planctomycetota bacterium]
MRHLSLPVAPRFSNFAALAPTRLGTGLRAATLVAATLVGAAMLAACAAGRGADGGAAVDEQVDVFLAARQQRLAAARADFARRAPFPRVERFPQGTVIVARAELMGGIDREFLRLRVTYVNESTQTYDRIRLHFVVRDGLGRIHGRQDVDFVMPLDYRFTPGNSYTDEVHVPTGGAHEHPGWDLGVEMQAEAW